MFLVQHIRHFAVHTNDDNQRPAVKRRELIRQGLGRWVIDLSLDRFEGIEKIIERREENDPLARRVLRVNEACALPSTDTADACHKERWTHPESLTLPLPGEPWNPRGVAQSV